jgi:hypothetical protein
MIDLLQSHHATIAELLTSARELQPETKGAQITMTIYTTILEDGLSILQSLIDHLSNG